MPQASQHAFTRRGFCLCCLGATTLAAGGGWLSPAAVFAKARTIVDAIRDKAAEAPITVHRLRGGVFVLEGSGGNIAVLDGPDGKVLIDAGITASRPRLLEALAGIGGNPIRQLVNTHWHFDHTDGNEWLHGEGATIIAHENTLKHLAVATRVDDWDFDFPRSPSGALPAKVFSDKMSLVANRTTLHLERYAPAHTDSDISVRFSEPDILHAGDTFWNGFYPFIDYSTGGSIDGTIKAAEANLAAVSDDTIVIPGHGPGVSDKAGLLQFRDMLLAIRDKVAALKGQGLSLEDVVAARPTASFDETWGAFAVGPALFTKLVYIGV